MSEKQTVVMPTGLTKREYFAAMALQGLLSDNANLNEHWVNLSQAAVEYADELIKELEKEE